MFGEAHRDSADSDTPVIEILSDRISNLPLWCRVPWGREQTERKNGWSLHAQTALQTPHTDSESTKKKKKK